MGEMTIVCVLFDGILWIEYSFKVKFYLGIFIPNMQMKPFFLIFCGVNEKYIILSYMKFLDKMTSKMLDVCKKKNVPM